MTVHAGNGSQQPERLSRRKFVGLMGGTMAKKALAETETAQPEYEDKIRKIPMDALMPVCP